MRKHSKAFARHALAYWQNMLNEAKAEEAAENSAEETILVDDIVKYLTKVIEKDQKKKEKAGEEVAPLEVTITVNGAEATLDDINLKDGKCVISINLPEEETASEETSSDEEVPEDILTPDDVPAEEEPES